ncbi:MAG: polyprenyl synthetase family protein [Planctomycetota bacterium]
MSPAEAANNDFNTLLPNKAQLVNDTLQQLLAKHTEINSDLKDAIKYTLFAPGKRVRSALVLFCCELVGGKINHNAEIAAAAIEMVHTYSLVHDDLPAMDDDDFRRGQPTCHKAFDEATAILTGDALLTLAFEILANEIDDPAVAIQLVRELAEAAGPAGMIAGQMADLKAPLKKTQANEQELRAIHINKTAKMFRCAAAMGVVCGGANKSHLDRLSEYGLKIGLGFQIADDILDVCASSEQLGKTAGKDAEADKCTYPAVVGIEKSKQLAKNLADEAAALLEPFGQKADTLRQLAVALLERTK